VRIVRLADWIAQGEDRRYCVKRLLPEHGALDSAAISALHHAGERYMGRPYDTSFLWDDERIYCSELVWKVYEEGIGIELCPLKTLREFDLKNAVVRSTMKERYGADPPLDEPVVAPSTLFECPMLVTVAERQ
jgi:hypothetical protein